MNTLSLAGSAGTTWCPRPPLRPWTRIAPHLGHEPGSSSRCPVSQEFLGGTRSSLIDLRSTSRILACNSTRSSSLNSAHVRFGLTRACQRISSASRFPRPASTDWSTSAAFTRRRIPPSSSHSCARETVIASGPIPASACLTSSSSARRKPSTSGSSGTIAGYPPRHRLTPRRSGRQPPAAWGWVPL
jgi:hypothetical protein